MGRGKFKGKPTGHRHFSTPEELRTAPLSFSIFAGTSARPRTFKQEEETICILLEITDSLIESEFERFRSMAEALALWWLLIYFLLLYQEEAEVEEEEEESEEEVEDEQEKKKGTQGIIEIENPNLAKSKNVKAKDADMGRTTELSRREREEIEKQKAHERYMRLQEQGKTEQARKDLERLALIRQQRAEAAKKREEEKAAKEQKKVEARK
ncbi:hypothetical protein Patl1_04763 [Pistacia atlantica]|uniref:Uncharacterized protein n=1 Tax=Pistacia atlantica TaxID=434234 RepID=A0ACC1BVW7_9ROSI|nr:hypothetical protein Patl1_04763 [Pistacia atlantica]